MTENRRAHRRIVVLAATIATLGAGGLAVAMADSAGAAAPTAMHMPTRTVNAGLEQTAGSASATPVNASSAAPSTQSSSASALAGTAPNTASTSSAAAGAVTRVQLAPSLLPAAAAEKWSPAGPLSTRNVAGHDIGENECAKIHGASSWSQQGYIGGDGQNPAIQDTFTFPGAAAAQTAYQDFAAAMADCQSITRAYQASHRVPTDAAVTETASVTGEAAAWKRSWTGVMGMSAQGPQTNHYYLAVSGTRLIVLQFTEFPGNAGSYDSAADPQVLAMLDAELAR